MVTVSVMKEYFFSKKNQIRATWWPDSLLAFKEIIRISEQVTARRFVRLTKALTLRSVIKLMLSHRLSLKISQSLVDFKVSIWKPVQSFSGQYYSAIQAP